ncbi:MAG: PQQ-dependent sugar dehydrogenase [Hyphomicrobium sp.]|uniref:PQQ-dependent sugar dehydrogenase n=1 Tax=Hyphomicrobium sp. TaxID=82 RepID=UPI0013257272|nr:PQQ-dependent sugar dehydrogenase [Hyphomicrobium sp.]KAB2944076.1 MAG: PQQ-dependent sugar dehydrogenase [Hyphomicrobium sp.]MBZ0209369.1 PQQ-dependent sugar dehydrogenase [Hyphomicrobium sp.]
MISSSLRSLAFSIIAAVGATTEPVEAVITDAPAPAKPSRIKVETFASGLDHPWGMQFLPDGRLLVTERLGRMRIISKDGRLSPAILDGLPEVAVVGQGGLLDVLLAPDFETSHIIYLSYGEPRGDGKNGTSVARAKLVFESDGAKLEDLKVIFRQQPAAKSGHHFGSRLVWARDGTLFVTTGERNSLRDQSQNPANDIGKIIRINADGSIPNDNPKLPGWAPEVWSIGHRNVQGAALRPDTGELYAVEHGARGGDELNRPEKGKNYGWPVITYGIDYSGAKIGEGITAKEGMEQPLYYWVPSIATSGLAFYTGDLFPEWKSNAFVGGLNGTQVQRLVLEGDNVVAAETLLEDQAKRIRDVRAGPDGALWLLTDDTGEVLRVTPAND